MFYDNPQIILEYYEVLKHLLHVVALVPYMATRGSQVSCCILALL